MTVPKQPSQDESPLGRPVEPPRGEAGLDHPPSPIPHPEELDPKRRR